MNETPPGERLIRQLTFIMAVFDETVQAARQRRADWHNLAHARRLLLKLFNAAGETLKTPSAEAVREAEELRERRQQQRRRPEALSWLARSFAKMERADAELYGIQPDVQQNPLVQRAARIAAESGGDKKSRP